MDYNKIENSAPAIPATGALPAQAPLVPPAPPEAFLVAREDVLTILLQHEQEQRLAAQTAALKTEQTLLRLQLSQKYGVDFTQYTIDTLNNVAKRNPK